MVPRPAFCWFTTVEATSILKRWRLLDATSQHMTACAKERKEGRREFE